MFGPWSGKLNNRSEAITLERPQFPDLPGDDYSWVIEDEIVCGNQAPWASAAGNGKSLLRLVYSQSDLDPLNWAATPPTPGTLSDRDEDGMSDADEAIAGTDPDDPDSYFKITPGNGTGFSWDPVTGRTYSVYWTEDLTVPFVPIVTGLPHTQSNYTDLAHATNAANFYRLEVDYQE